MTPDIGLAITISAATELVEPVAAGWQLILAALAGIALIVVLVILWILRRMFGSSDD